MSLQANEGTNAKKQVADWQVVLGGFSLVNFSCPGSPTPTSLHDPKVDFASALIDTYRV